MVEECHFNLILSNLIVVKRKEKEKVEHGKDSKIVVFGHVLFLKIAHLHFGAWSLLLVHVRFTHSEGPKDFKICIIHKYDHGSVSMGKGISRVEPHILDRITIGNL